MRQHTSVIADVPEGNKLKLTRPELPLMLSLLYDPLPEGPCALWHVGMAMVLDQ